MTRRGKERRGEKRRERRREEERRGERPGIVPDQTLHVVQRDGLTGRRQHGGHGERTTPACLLCLLCLLLSLNPIQPADRRPGKLPGCTWLDVGQPQGGARAVPW